MPELAKELEPIVETAKEMGLKVWTFKPSGKTINQVFFDNGEYCGTAHIRLFSPGYGTIHKPNRECGAGFGIDVIGTIEESINATLRYAPDWAYNQARKANIIKESMADHIANSTLEWYEL